MAFALLTVFDGEKFFIHKDFGKNDSALSLSRNMNFAMLFAVESDANRFCKRNELKGFQPHFVPIALKEKVERDYKKYYRTLNRGSVDDVLPDFLKGV